MVFLAAVIGFCGPWAQGPGPKSPRPRGPGQDPERPREGPGRTREGPGGPREPSGPKEALISEGTTKMRQSKFLTTGEFGRELVGRTAPNS